MTTLTVSLDGQESALLVTAVDKALADYADGNPVPADVVAGSASVLSKLSDDGTDVTLLLTDQEQHAVRRAVLAERAWAAENALRSVDDDQTDEADWQGVVALCDRILQSVSG